MSLLARRVLIYFDAQSCRYQFPGKLRKMTRCRKSDRDDDETGALSDKQQCLDFGRGKRRAGLAKKSRSRRLEGVRGDASGWSQSVSVRTGVIGLSDELTVCRGRVRKLVVGAVLLHYSKKVVARPRP